MRFCYFGLYDPEFSRNRVYIRALRDAGHEVIECKDSSRGPMKYFRLATRLRALRGSYDAIIVGYPGHVVVPIARLFGSGPVVADLLGSLADAATQSHGAGFLRRTWLSVVDRLAIACAHVLLVESEAQKKYLTSRYGGNRYAVVYTGADGEIFKPRPEHVTGKPFVVLFRGRLTPESGIAYILDVADSLKNDTNYVFRIIGYGRLLDMVRSRVALLPNVTLISEHLTFDEMRNHMLDADVSLGQFEANERLDRTIPHKAFESIAMGIPYLTARARGVSEILEDGVSCLMVPVANSDAIKRALERLHDDLSLRARLVRGGSAAYASFASSRVIASTIESVVSDMRARVRSAATKYPKFSKREFIMLGILLTAFIVIRVPGLSLPYHQDEGKTAEIVRSNIVGALSGHPPLTELIYRKGGDLVGADHLRVIPLVFGLLSAALLYLVVRHRSGIRAAMFALGLYGICMYGVWASLMIDTDGAILPTLFLLAVYGYDRFRATGANVRWLGVVAVALLFGMLTKLSFILVLGTLGIDYLIEIRDRLSRGLIFGAVLGGIGFSVVAMIAIVSAHFLVSSFDVSETVAHAMLYVRLAGRGYMQIAIQAVKAFFFLSPLLFAPLLFLSKKTFTQNRIFGVYLMLGAFFYFVLFDFSQGALDKYLMFAIVPLCAFVGAVFSEHIRGVTHRSVVFGTMLGLVFAGALVALNFLSPQALPLYPKAEWVSAIRHGSWNILMPFTGGSGPLGFYISFLFIAVGFATALALAIAGRTMPRFRAAMLTALIVVGVSFNAVFVEELLWGRINGSAPDVLRTSLAYIASSDVQSVISHGDSGAYELLGMGKYGGRFYAVPGNEDAHRGRFAQHKGHYLVVDFPQLNKGSFYSNFFDTCERVFETRSGAIEGDVYYCPTTDPYSIK